MPVAPRIVRQPAALLIELLVVVAVIAVLASILLPALGGARRQVRRVVCQSNLRGLSQAWHIYLEESDGHFPRWADLEFNFGGQQGAGNMAYGLHPRFPKYKPLNTVMGLSPYHGRFLSWGGQRADTKGAELFACPADRGGPGVQPTHFDYYGTSYRMNEFLVGQDQFDWAPDDPCTEVFARLNAELKSITCDDIRDTARLILMGDTGWAPAWRTGTVASEQRTEWHDRPNRHNIAFMDGHVEFLRIEKGMHTTGSYTTIPLFELAKAACDCQESGEWK